MLWEKYSFEQVSTCLTLLLYIFFLFFISCISKPTHFHLSWRFFLFIYYLFFYIFYSLLLLTLSLGGMHRKRERLYQFKTRIFFYFSRSLSCPSTSRVSWPSFVIFALRCGFSVIKEKKKKIHVLCPSVTFNYGNSQHFESWMKRLWRFSFFFFFFLFVHLEWVKMREEEKELDKIKLNETKKKKSRRDRLSLSTWLSEKNVIMVFFLLNLFYFFRLLSLFSLSSLCNFLILLFFFLLSFWCFARCHGSMNNNLITWLHKLNFTLLLLYWI